MNHWKILAFVFLFYLENFVSTVKGFPIVRGRVELLHVPEWSDSNCKTVAFPPYRFYPDKQVHVQVTIHHMKLNDSVTVHDAVTSWTENISPKNFTICVMQTGRKQENFNPFSSVDWIAYQGAPPEGLTGKIELQKWWYGTNFAVVTFPKDKFTEAPVVLVTSEHLRTGNEYDAALIWLEDTAKNSFKACLREMQNFDGKHEDITVDEFTEAPVVLVTSEHLRTGNEYDAALIWLEDTTKNSFKACLREMQNFGGKHEDITVNWFAFAKLHKPLFNEHGVISFPNTSPQTEENNNADCEFVLFTRAYNSAPTTLISANHRTTASGNSAPEHNGITAWIENMNCFGFRAGVKELYQSRYDPHVKGEDKKTKERIRITMQLLGSERLCDPGWSHLNGFCYYTSQTCTNWITALSKCRQNNSILTDEWHTNNYRLSNVISGDRGCYRYTCKKDHNECGKKTSDCHFHATCTNTVGSYSCKCNSGYVGNGFDCKYIYRYGGLERSSILQGNDNYLGNLSNWLKPVVQSKSSQWMLCWHASVDGWAASTFHSRCDNKGPTVTIIKVGQYIFGGYASVSWISSCDYQYDSRAFLFSLVNKPGWAPVKLTQTGRYSYYMYSIFGCSSYGPTFGGGHDIEVSDHASSNTYSHTSGLGFTYAAPSGYTYRDAFAYTFLAGGSDAQFQPDEVETLYRTT